MNYGNKLQAMMFLTLAILLFGCATTGQMGSKATTIEVSPFANGRMIVTVREDGQVIDQFDSNTRLLVYVDGMSTRRDKLVCFVDASEVDPNTRSYHVSAKLFARLEQSFQVKPFSELIRLTSK